MIYERKELGFCLGIKLILERLMQEKKNGGNMYVLSPLIHNEIENKNFEKIGLYTYQGHLNEDDILVFPAHGHTVSEEEEFRHFRTIDCACPFIIERYKIIEKRANSCPCYLIGKKGHREVISLLSHFPFLQFISEDGMLPPLDGKSKQVIFQSTCSYTHYRRLATEISTRADISILLNPCPFFLTRIKNVQDQLANNRVSSAVVLGSKTSANANSLLSILPSEIEKQIANSVEEIDPCKLKKDETLIVSSMSISQDRCLQIINDLEGRL